MSEGAKLIDGIIELEEDALREWHHQEDMNAQDREHSEIFAGYTTQEYLTEQVYGPKQ
jgi:hypothetical protein